MMSDSFTFYWKFLWLQNSFDKIICDELFDDDSDHIYDLWIRSGYNIITFLAYLDDDNKEVLFKWDINK